MAKDRNIVEPINAPFDEVVDSIVHPATPKTNNANRLEAKMARLPATQKQLVLDIGVQIQKDVNGIEMGVLDNGIPYLTQNGLSRIAGAARSVIYDIAQEWADRFEDEVLPGRSRFRLSANQDTTSLQRQHDIGFGAGRGHVRKSGSMEPASRRGR